MVLGLLLERSGRGTLAFVQLLLSKKSTTVIFLSPSVSKEGWLQQGEEKNVGRAMCCDEPHAGHSVFR